MALRPKLDEIVAKVEGTVSSVMGEIDAAEAEIDALAVGVTTPLQGFGAMVTAAKGEVTSQVEAIVAELRTMVE